jgi:hypothetical protein
MNSFSRISKIVVIAMIVFLLLVVMVVTAKDNHQAPSLLNFQMAPSATRPFHCVPLPFTETSDSNPTPTPIRYALAEDHPRPTVTLRAFTNTFDLSPELPLEQKSTTIVFRCDGSFDQYLAGVTVNVDRFINLMPGDVIIGSSAPAVMMQRQPPSASNWLVTPFNTPVPYPVDDNSLQETLSQFPYPVLSTYSPTDNQP